MALVQLVVFYLFCGWVLKLKLMLTQSPTELELELGLSLAKMITVDVRFENTIN